MERESTEREDRPARRRAEEAAAEDLGIDDQEFSSVEDVGPEPNENIPVDDV